jgi:hypothetical protein
MHFLFSSSKIHFHCVVSAILSLESRGRTPMDRPLPELSHFPTSLLPYIRFQSSGHSVQQNVVS